MKCRVFTGAWNQTQDAFNNWAKGRSLDKTTIIHSHSFMYYSRTNDNYAMLTIVVFYAEDSQWEPVAR